MLPLLFQIGLGKSAFSSGLLMLAYAAATSDEDAHDADRAALRVPAHRRDQRLHRRVFACDVRHHHAGDADAVIALLLFASGLCRSLQFTTVNTLGFVDVPQPMMSSASTLSSTFTQLAQAGGIAAGALILHGVETVRGSADARPDGFSHRLLGIRAIAVAATITMLSLPRSAGADVSGSATG